MVPAGAFAPVGFIVSGLVSGAKNKEAPGALDRDPTLDVSGRDTGLTPQEFITPGHNIQASFARLCRHSGGSVDRSSH
jgi:hypothetical protein